MILPLISCLIGGFLDRLCYYFSNNLYYVKSLALRFCKRFISIVILSIDAVLIAESITIDKNLSITYPIATAINATTPIEIASATLEQLLL